MGLLEQFLRYAEPAATLGSSAVAEPIAGWAGMLGGGAGAVQKTREALTYQPRTPQGQAGLNALAQALQSAKTTMVDENPPANALANALRNGMDYVGDRSPAAGAALATLPAAAMAFLGPGSSVTRQAFANVGLDAVRGANQLAQFMGQNVAAVPAMRGPMIAQRGSIGVQKPFTYPQDEAMETARKNAVEMLGLPENNTAMDRAMALGFKTNAYHGGVSDIDKFNNPLNWVAEKSEFANIFAAPENGAVYPLKIRTRGSFDAAGRKFQGEKSLKTWRKNLQESGVNMDGVTLQDWSPGYGKYNFFDLFPHAGNNLSRSGDGGITSALNGYSTLKMPEEVLDGVSSGRVHAVINPINIRSRFAAFDPARVNEADLLGAADPQLLKYIAAGSAAPFVYESLSEKKK